MQRFHTWYRLETSEFASSKLVELQAAVALVGNCPDLSEAKRAMFVFHHITRRIHEMTHQQDAYNLLHHSELAVLHDMSCRTDHQGRRGKLPGPRFPYTHNSDLHHMLLRLYPQHMVNTHGSASSVQL